MRKLRKVLSYFEIILAVLPRFGLQPANKIHIKWMYLYKILPEMLLYFYVIVSSTQIEILNEPKLSAENFITF